MRKVRNDVVRYSKVTRKDGRTDELCLFYSNISVRGLKEADQIAADLRADGREMAVAYVLEWKDEPVKLSEIV